MEKMQEFIDFIFFEVWCKAPTNGPFDLNLFNAYPDLKVVMEAFYYSDAQGAEFFYGHIERIHGLFSVLTTLQVDELMQWYQCNNNIEQACANNSSSMLLRYEDVPLIYQELGQQLATFFKGLYSQSLLGLVALKEKIGDIDDHYKNFTQTNKVDKCPFCGIHDLLGEYHSKREAYDHYLPKAIYPFNSINFKNLVPACHHCNSSFKTSKDPTRAVKDPARNMLRRKIFYPFTTTPYKIDLEVTLKNSDIQKLTPVDIELTFGPIEITEQIDTWKDVYRIEERYKAKFCADNDGKYWLMQVFDEWKEDNRLPEDFLKTIKRQANNAPYAECNFLKRPFLEACRNRGIFNVAND